MGNEISKPNNAGNPKSLMAAQTDYVGAIGRGLQSIVGKIDSYQATCGYNILMAINVALAKDNLNFKSPEVDRETINNAIKYAIIYRLNTDNKEVFVIVRNEKRGKKKDENGRDVDNWIKVVEVKPQYKGVLKILSDCGRDVERIYPEWIVREGDEFEYQTFKGIDVVPPTWKPHGYEGKILRVVVPIKYKDGTVDYRIAERESVATNIKAQIKQNVMFNKDKEIILAKIQDMTLDQLLADKTLINYINETYTGISKDEMLITKLVLNATKRVQIDYQSALARELNENTFDNADVYKKNHTAEDALALAGAPMLEEVKEIEVKEEAQPEPKPEPAAGTQKPEVDEDGVVHRREPSDDGINLFEYNNEND